MDHYEQASLEYNGSYNHFVPIAWSGHFGFDSFQHQLDDHDIEPEVSIDPCSDFSYANVGFATESPSSLVYGAALPASGSQSSFQESEILSATASRLNRPVESQMRPPNQSQNELCLTTSLSPSLSLASTPPSPSCSSPSEIESARTSRQNSCSNHSRTCYLSEAEARTLRTERRRHQNRVSQKKSRERKEAKLEEISCHITNMEAHIRFLQQYNEQLEATNNGLQQHIAALTGTQTFGDVS